MPSSRTSARSASYSWAGKPRVAPQPPSPKGPSRPPGRRTTPRPRDPRTIPQRPVPSKPNVPVSPERPVRPPPDYNPRPNLPARETPALDPFPKGPRKPGGTALPKFNPGRLIGPMLDFMNWADLARTVVPDPMQFVSAWVGPLKDFDYSKITEGGSKCCDMGHVPTMLQYNRAVESCSGLCGLGGVPAGEFAQVLPTIGSPWQLEVGGSNARWRGGLLSIGPGANPVNGHYTRMTNYEQWSFPTGPFLGSAASGARSWENSPNARLRWIYDAQGYVAPVAGSVRNSIDPAQLPIFTPIGTPVAIPVSWVGLSYPAFGTVDGLYSRLASYHAYPPRPSAPPVAEPWEPWPSIDVEIQPGQKPRVGLGSHFNRPPGRGEKEKKMKARTNVGLVLEALAEGADFVDAIYKSIPGKYRRWKGRDGKWRDSAITPQDKIKFIWTHFERVDVADALTNLVENEAEDQGIGRFNNWGKKSYARNPYYTRPAGFGAGPAM